MKVDDVIVLENKQKYCLLKETVLDNNRYFMAAEVDKNNNLNDKKLAFFKHIIDGDTNYVVRVKDDTLIYRLSEMFVEDAM